MAHYSVRARRDKCFPFSIVLLTIGSLVFYTSVHQTYSAAQMTTTLNIAQADMASSINWSSIQLINKKTLLGMIPLSEKAIYNMEKRGDFPKRIALTTRNVAWDLAEVAAWIEGRKASGDQAARPGQTVIVS